MSLPTQMFAVFLVSLLLQTVLVQPKPNAEYTAKHYKHRKSGNLESAVSEDSTYNYLMEFDYLPKSDIETGALRTEEQFKDAIRNLQRFGNIPVTGEIDNATKQLIKRPRCGVGDSNQTLSFSPDNLHHGRVKRYVLQGPKWDKTDLTWSLVNQSMPDAGKVRMTLRKALNVWQSSSKLTFREVYSEKADIQVLFAKRDHGDGYKFDGPGLVLAHAFYPGVGRGGDAHFDDDENWSFDSEPKLEEEVIGTDFLGVSVHEFGHSLGLGHSSDQNAIMFPWYQGYQVGSDLPNDDRTAIQELYGPKVKTWGSYQPPPRPPTTTTTTTTTTTPRPYNYPISPRRPYQPSQQQPTDGRHYNHNRHNQHYNNNNNNNNNNNHHHNHNPYYPNYDHTSRPYYPAYRTPATTTTNRPYVHHHVTTTTRRPRIHPTQRYNPQQKPPVKPTKPRKLKPDSCMTHYDAISMIREELFIFRGQYLWRIGDRGLYPGYPTETRRLWTALPANFNKIDAVYENHNRHIIFFIGRKYYEFDSVTLIRENHLTALGLPTTLANIDAAFVWGHNNRTYLFSGTLYWSMDRETGRAELDYPRDLSIWSGIGYNIDAAFQYTNHKTYFFKGLGYWEFNDNIMKVAHEKKKSSAREWMKCPRNANEVDDEQNWTARLISEAENGDEASKSTTLMRGSKFTIIWSIFIAIIGSIRLVDTELLR